MEIGNQNHNYMEIWRNKLWRTYCCLGDLHHMATKETIGNTSLGIQHSRDVVVPSRSCLLPNKFIAWTL